MTFKQGLKDGIPIFLGYLAVSFAFGIFCMSKGLTPLVAIITSLTNLTSAGQFAGVKLMAEVAPYIEIFLTILLINLRYSLMSIALSQKLEDQTKTYQKLIFGFGVTDEVFALAVQKEKIGAKYMYGLILLPIVGWTLGTALGCISSEILPTRVLDALKEIISIPSSLTCGRTWCIILLHSIFKRSICRFPNHNMYSNSFPIWRISIPN